MSRRPASGGGSRQPVSRLPFDARRARYLRRVYLLPLFLFLCLTLPKLGQGEFNVDTGWYSAIALQSWRAAFDGDPGSLWSLAGYGGPPASEPYGSHYFNKPPLAFWLHGVSLAIFGPNLFGARLPAVFAGAGVVLLATLIALRLSGRVVALLSGTVLALTIEFTRHSRAFSLDMWQTLFLFAALALVVEAVHRSRAWLVVAAGVPIGLALLTKPFVGLIALPIFAVWLVWVGRARWTPLLVAALAVAAAVAAPWHISMVMLHGDVFTGQYFGREILARARGELSNFNADAHNPLYYGKVLLQQYWPWLATFVLALVVAFRRGLDRRAGSPAVGLAIIWIAVWVLLLSIFPDKRPRYLLPIYPAAAWLSAMWLAYAAPRGVKRLRNGLARWAVPVVGVGAVIVAVAPLPIEPVREPWYGKLFAKLREDGRRDLWYVHPQGARAARVYLEFGYWPRSVYGAAGNVVALPPAGALLMYHDEDPERPLVDEPLYFASGDLTVTRVVGRPGAAEETPTRRPVPAR